MACEKVLEQALSVRQRGWVEAVAMDMWPAYLSATKGVLPGREVVHDRYHIAAYLNDAVDQVRRSEYQALRETRDQRLAKNRYLWQSGEERLSEQAAERFGGLKREQLKTARA